MIFINYINHYQLLLVPYHILVSYQSKKRTEKKKKKSSVYTRVKRTRKNYNCRREKKAISTKLSGFKILQEDQQIIRPLNIAWWNVQLPFIHSSSLLLELSA